MQRRLAAILAADVVGYSRLMGQDETGTLERLKALHRELVHPTIRSGNGRVVKLMGDGLLAEFASVVDAVKCAFDIQQAIVLRDPDAGDENRIRLRIGINLGDVIVEGADIYGDGVNVAARLEGLAEPDGICISGHAFDLIDGKLDVSFEDIGDHQVKNIAKPIRVFKLAGASLPTPAERSAHRPDAATKKPPIAVLPFTNMSGSPEQEYFSDGISEDLITELSRFRELSVISRSSSFVFKDKEADVSEISQRLKVQYIVEGSIRKSGNRVRITAQLIDADSDQHIWADRYDRDLEDIFELQDDIVRRVASTLVDRLEHQRQERVRRQSESELKAYDLYLRGRELFFNWSIEDNTEAREHLRAALTHEPDYAAALALLAEVQLRMWLNGWATDGDAVLSDALQLAQRAVEIDDQDSRTHTAIGMVNLFHEQLDKAKNHFETAMRLNPNDTRVLAYYSRYAVFDGDPNRAIDLCNEALVLNPYGKYNWNLGLAYFVAREYGQTIQVLEAMGNPPEVVLAILAASYAMTGDDAKATSTSARLFEDAKRSPVLSQFTESDDWRGFFSARWPFRDAANLDHLLDALRKGGVPA